MNWIGIAELGILVLQRLRASDELSLRVVLLRQMRDKSAMILILLVFRGFVLGSMSISYQCNRYQVLRLSMSFCHYIEPDSWVQCGTHALIPLGVDYVTFSYYQITTSTYQKKMRPIRQSSITCDTLTQTRSRSCPPLLDDSR